MIDNNPGVMTSENTGDPVVKSPVVTRATGQQTYEYLMYYILGAIEVALAFRLILKIAGANVGSGFVQIIYVLTDLLVLPFRGIFQSAYSTGTTASVFEPAVLVAMIVYAVLAWGLVKLIKISSGEQQTS
jgi:hypothetical protein